MARQYDRLTQQTGVNDVAFVSLHPSLSSTNHFTFVATQKTKNDLTIVIVFSLFVRSRQTVHMYVYATSPSSFLCIRFPFSAYREDGQNYNRATCIVEESPRPLIPNLDNQYAKNELSAFNSASGCELRRPLHGRSKS